MECLEDQQLRLEGDWKYAKKICSLCPDLFEALTGPRGTQEDTFLSVWFYIESKAYIDPRKPYVPWSTSSGPNDWQILFPVVDHLAFSPEGCSVETNDTVYKFKATRDYKAGDIIDLQCQYDAPLSLVTSGKVSHNVSRDPEPLSSCGGLSPIEEEQSPISQ
ncbi:hypothetical protein ACHAO7_011601, partial [Fusarium culmorum]